MITKILHIINSFEYGGAEAMLCNILARTDRDRFEPVVVSLIDDLRLAGAIVDSGTTLHVMGMRPGVPDPRGVARLASCLRRERPALIQTWMDHSNLIGSLAILLSGTRTPLVWGLHHAHHAARLSKRTTLWTVAACAQLSRRLPARIVCCSDASRVAYEAWGFAADRLEVIPNGFDTETFRPDPEARCELRRALGVGPDALLVGLIARYDPLKDHENFLRAAASLARGAEDGDGVAGPSRRAEVTFVLCGDGVDARNKALGTTIDALGLRGRCHLLGPRPRLEVARIMAGLDLVSSSSCAEAFPLTVGEAMACGVPCAVTDVGDSAAIVGDTGWVVPPRDSTALADSWRAALDMSRAERSRRGMEARRRIRESFDLDLITRRYESLYESLMGVEARQGGKTFTTVGVTCASPCGARK
jgi:glycosyltransferase involved in cell wall biosynthesis